MGFENNLTSFEIARPVLAGASMNSAILLVRGLLEKHFPDNFDQGGLLIPGKISMDGENIEQSKLIGRSGFSEYNKFRVPIVRYVADLREISSAPDFDQLASKVKRPLKIQSTPLRTAMLAQREATSGEIGGLTATAFDMSRSELKAGHEVSLLLNNSKALVEEALAWNAIFGRIKDMKPVVRVAKESFARFDSMRMPLALIDECATDRQLAGFFDDLSSNSSRRYRLNLGPTLLPFVR